MANGPFYAEGTYVSEIVAQALGETKTGKPQFVIKCKILGTPSDDGSYIPANNQYERSVYMVLTEATMPYVIEKLATLGFKGKSFGQLDPEHPQAQRLIGNQVDLYCKHEYGQDNQLREKWDISRGGGLQIKPLESRKVRELDSLFGKSLASIGSPSVIATQQRQKPLEDGTFIDDSEIPF